MRHELQIFKVLSDHHKTIYLQGLTPCTDNRFKRLLLKECSHFSSVAVLAQLSHFCSWMMKQIKKPNLHGLWQISFLGEGVLFQFWMREAMVFLMILPRSAVVVDKSWGKCAIQYQKGLHYCSFELCSAFMHDIWHGKKINVRVQKHR